jgi:hypothetical protein
MLSHPYFRWDGVSSGAGRDVDAVIMAVRGNEVMVVTNGTRDKMTKANLNMTNWRYCMHMHEFNDPLGG